MTVWARFNRLSLWNKLFVIAGLASILSLLLTIAFYYSSRHSSASTDEVRPELKATFLMNHPKHLYELKILNYGVVSVADLRIRLVVRVLTSLNKIDGGLRSSKDWHSQEYLRPKASVSYPVDLDQYSRMCKLEKAANIHIDFVAYTYLISYRRESDMREFRIFKTLFFGKGETSNEPTAFDPDEHGDEFFRAMARDFAKADQDYQFY